MILSVHSPAAQSGRLWRWMRALNRRMVARYRRGIGPRGLVLLLTTTGRKSGLPRVTPLQYECVGDDIYVASARGAQADWFCNLVAEPRVVVQIGQDRRDALAEPIRDPARVADFLALRLCRHPIMMRLMLLFEGVPPWGGRTALERIAVQKTIVALRPVSGS